MSLTSVVQDRDSFFWNLLKKKGTVSKLTSFCKILSGGIGSTLRPICAANDRATVGMAMRYAIMSIYGDKHLANHPISKRAYSLNVPPFNQLYTEFGSRPEAALLFMAILDAKLRGHIEDWMTSELIRTAMKKNNGLRKLPDHPRWIAATSDICNLYSTMQNHFRHVSIRYKTVECVYCGTPQQPQKIWSCVKCGAPLVYNGDAVSSISIGDHMVQGPKIDLIPTYAAEIGGADAPLSIGHQMFSTRTVAKAMIQPEHILMAWGWKALYDENECPPWETFTIYYTRQGWEVTLEFESVSKLLNLQPQEFRDCLEKNTYEDDDWLFDSEDWGDHS